MSGVVFRSLRLMLLSLAAAATIGCVENEPPDANILGAGSTFAAPLYEHWAERLHSTPGTEVRYHYDAVGSGEGVRRFLAG